MIISRAPVRISFFGGGTDYPEFFLREGGAVLAAAVDKFSYVTASPFLSHLFDYAMRISYRKVELVRAVRELPSHMEKFPRWSCRATAYWPVTLDWAAPAEGLLPSDSACIMVSEGLRTWPSLVLATTRTGPPLLMHNRPFSPYINSA